MNKPKTPTKIVIPGYTYVRGENAIYVIVRDKVKRTITYDVDGAWRRLLREAALDPAAHVE